MPKRTVSIKGQKGKTYDLDRIAAGSRENSAAPLIAQVYEYGDGDNPNPANPAIGQIWLSKKK
jgi:hypothetical protein